MTVVRSDVRVYGSANMPDGDGATTGGAVSFSKKPSFSDLLANGTVNYVSSASGDTTQTIALTGRDASGVLQTENKTFNGVTVVTGTQTFERLMKGIITGTAAGDLAVISNTKVISAHTAQAGAAQSASEAASITLQSGDGASVAIGQIVRITNNSPAGVNNQLREIVAISGDVVYVNRDWGTVPTSATTYDVHTGMLFQLSPNQITEIRRISYDAAADAPGGSQRDYYEKVFVVNDNTATALTSAVITLQADTTGDVQIALTNALNDTATVANRQTVPASGITAFTSGSPPQSINVPSPQNLPSGNAPNSAGAQGVWTRLRLPAGSAPQKGSITLRGAGNTT